MTDPECASAAETQTAQKPDKWIIIEGLIQTRKNIGIVVFAALLHFVMTTLSEMFQIEGLSLQQLYSGSVARYILLEVLVSVVGVVAIVPVLMATNVSLI